MQSKYSLPPPKSQGARSKPRFDEGNLDNKDSARTREAVVNVPETRNVNKISHKVCGMLRDVDRIYVDCGGKKETVLMLPPRILSPLWNK